MSNKEKSKELRYCGVFENLIYFTPAAVDRLTRFITEHIKIFIDESVLIAEERDISDGMLEVTPSHVTKAVNDFKDRHPRNKKNIRIIIADIIILISTIVINIVFALGLFPQHPIISFFLLLFGVCTFICTSIYKIANDSNWGAKS